MVDAVRKNRRRTLEARRAKKLALAPTLGNARGLWLNRILRSAYVPNDCQKEGKR